MAHEAAPPPAQGSDTTLLVFAAASLTEALEAVDGAFSAATHIEVKTSYAASSLLAKQIEAGAHADVFFSADREWMDYLDTRALLRSSSRADVLGNTLVLVAPLQSPVQLQISPGFPLLAAAGAWPRQTRTRSRPDCMRAQRSRSWACGQRWSRIWRVGKMCARRSPTWRVATHRSGSCTAPTRGPKSAYGWWRCFPPIPTRPSCTRPP